MHVLHFLVYAAIQVKDETSGITAKIRFLILKNLFDYFLHFNVAT